MDQVLIDFRRDKNELLAIIKRLIFSYEGDVHFRNEVLGLLEKETGFVADHHPSLKMTFERLTATRGGM